jgi:hypothetical protein
LEFWAVRVNSTFWVIGKEMPRKSFVAKAVLVSMLSPLKRTPPMPAPMNGRMPPWERL